MAGLESALGAANSGLVAMSQKIAQIANDIANVQTVGYKSSEVTFRSFVTGSGNNSSGGVNSTTRQNVGEQGLIEATGRNTDIAISGQGFFLVQDSAGSLHLSRDGTFSIDKNGNLVNAAGFKLSAWRLDSEGRLPGASGNTLNTNPAESTDSIELVDVDTASSTATPTSKVEFGINLNANETTFQGATATIEFDTTSGVNNSLAQGDIIVPITSSTNSFMEGDTLTFTSNSSASTFTYGGFARSRLIDATNTIFSATSTSATFSTGTVASNQNSLANGDKFTITTTASGTATFEYKQTSPSTASGEFNSIDTLATAIDGTTGLTARVQGGVLYVSSTDATEAITFADVNSSNLHKELGFSNVLAGTDRFNTVEGLKTLVNNKSDLKASVNNPTSGASIDIFSKDPLQTLTITKNEDSATVNMVSAENGNNTPTTLIVNPSGQSLVGTSIVLNNLSSSGTVTATYGGVAISDTISSSNTMFSASSISATFTGLTTADGIRLSSVVSGTTVDTDFTYAASPSAGGGTFNSLATLAAAIDADSNYRARVENGKLYVAHVNADEDITFTDIDASGMLAHLGGTSINVTDSGAATRFASITELRTIINADADFSATAASSGAGSTFTISGLSSSTTVAISIDGTSNDTLIKELGLTDGGGTNDNAVGDGFFREFGLSSVVTAADADDAAEVAVTYSASDSTKNMAGGNVTPHFSRNISIFDSLGTGHNFRAGFLKIGSNKWAVELYALNDSTTGLNTVTNSDDGQVVTGTIEFNGDGTPASFSGGIASEFTIQWNADVSDAVDSAVTLDLGTAGSPEGTENASVIAQTDGLQQFNSNYNVFFVEQNGVAAGQFTGIEISEDGTISANFSNGQTKAIYRIPLGTVANANGLKAVSNNAYVSTQSSGEINVRQTNQGGAGQFSAASLEGSTADSSGGLTETISVEAAYGANAVIITVARDMQDQLNQRL
mgnify:CR=1 FL=1